MAEIKEFKTQTKRLLDMMINSIYTHKEIFLRELISNASDAIDKYHFTSLTNSSIEVRDYQILVEPNKDNRTLTISDNGIGFTYDELVDNLGTIAKSGSKEFLESLENKETSNVDIIGQFGVGFYSAFMVSKEVEVITKSPFSDKAYIFKSDGLESYSIDEYNEEVEGTRIILHLRDDNEDANYSEFLEEYDLKKLITKYSDYIRYPIKTWVTKYDEKNEDEKDKEDEDETSHQELETINSMIPLWKKSKSEVTDEMLNDFYTQKFYDFQEPLISMFINVEGNIEYNSLIFIPKKSQFSIYNDKSEKGLQLYTKGVFILDKCKELVPDHLKFIKGLVDCSSLSLNISREMLQEDKMLQKISTNLEKRILSELQRIKNNDYDKYVEFFNAYGLHIKFGIYEHFGAKKDQLKDLVIFNSLNSDKMISFKEYVEQMKENQEHIYYASGSSKEEVLALPQMDLLKKQEYNVLILTDDVDEFMIQVLKEYDGKSFKNITEKDLNLLDEEESKKIDEMVKEKQDFIKALKESLKNEVSDVIISKRLTDSLVCLVSEEGISLEMEKVLRQNGNKDVKATKILEVNPNHKVFKAIELLYNYNKDSVNKYAILLYSQALLIEKIPLEDPSKFFDLINDLTVDQANLINNTN